MDTGRFIARNKFPEVESDVPGQQKVSSKRADGLPAFQAPIFPRFPESQGEGKSCGTGYSVDQSENTGGSPQILGPSSHAMTDQRMSRRLVGQEGRDEIKTNQVESARSSRVRSRWTIAFKLQQSLNSSSAADHHCRQCGA